MIERLVQNGVLITSYFFDSDPQICFPINEEGSPRKLDEIAAKYPEHRLVLNADAETLFSAETGELQPWVSQIMTWNDRVILTPKPVETWGYQELELIQSFIILPATPEGMRVLSQVFHQGAATYALSEKPQFPLPESLRIQPHRWIDRNPPPSAQVETMLDLLQEYLAKEGFYWFSACAIFPELHWNITIYLGNVLKTVTGQSLLEVCSVSNMARLPWFRYGYIPDWLRDRLIKTLTHEQEQTIRTELRNLLVTAVQGSVGSLQLEIAKWNQNFIPKLANPILHLLCRRVPEDSPLRDYMFLSFMTGQPKLAIEVPDAFSRFVGRKKNLHWLIGVTLVSIFTISFDFPSIIRRFSPDDSISTPGKTTESELLKKLPITLDSGRRYSASIAISPDSQLIAAGFDSYGPTGSVILWDLSSGYQIRDIGGTLRQVRDIAFSPDGKMLASAELQIKIWNPLNGEQLLILSSHSEDIRSVVFTPDSKTLISGSSDSTIKIWNLSTGAEIRTLSGHSGKVMSVTLSQDGKTLASGSWGGDNTVKIWDLPTGEPMHTFPSNTGEGGTRGVLSVAISPNGSFVASGDTSGDIQIWDLSTKELIHTFIGHRGPVDSIIITPDSKFLASASSDGTVRIWDLSSGQLLSSLEGSSYMPSIAIGGGGKIIANTNRLSNTTVIQVFDLSAVISTTQSKPVEDISQYQSAGDSRKQKCNLLLPRGPGIGGQFYYLREKQAWDDLNCAELYCDLSSVECRKALRPIWNDGNLSLYDAFPDWTPTPVDK